MEPQEEETSLSQHRGDRGVPTGLDSSSIAVHEPGKANFVGQGGESQAQSLPPLANPAISTTQPLKADSSLQGSPYTVGISKKHHVFNLLPLPVIDVQSLP